MTDALSVVADIGGTNTRVALMRDKTLCRDTIQRFRNAENDGITPILMQYLADRSLTPQAVCVDMAGPVHDGIGKLTNLDWTVSADSLSRSTGAKTVSVLNDLQAQGHALPHISSQYLDTILPGRPATDMALAVRLVINVGTGLNAVPVYHSNGHTTVPPAEAGHIALTAQTPEELRLLEWLAARHGTPSLEEALSGRGIEQLYAFCCAEDGEGSALDAAAVMAAYRAGQDRARRAMQLFARYLGRYASDLALVTLPFGGIYFVGGVMGHVGPHLHDLGFAEAFSDKGRFASYMEQFPVFLLTDDYAALEGCVSHLGEKLAGAAED